MKDHFNELSGLFSQLNRRHETATVFSDFLTLALCSYHRTNLQSRLQEQDADNEALYMHTIKKYDKKELHIFPVLLGTVTLNARQAPYSDIIGPYYSEHITKGQNGQYFSPPAIGALMTKIQGAEAPKGKTVHDPACGAGGLLLEFAKQHPDNYFFGADNNQTCAKMSALNFFVNGLRGEVAWMNILSMKWYGGWQINTRGLGIIPIEKEQSRIWTKPPARPQKTEAQQLDLF